MISPLSICDDGNPCTFDVWILNGCVHNPVSAGTSCSLASLCGTPGACNGAGSCLPTEPVCDDSNACTTDACVYSLRAWRCSYSNAPFGTTCNDNNVCTAGEYCNGRGSCIGGSAVNPDDGNPCTIDTCDPVQGAQHSPVPDGTGCEDGDLCNGSELCDSGACQSGTPPVVDDGNPCTVDGCDPATGVLHTAVSDGTSCADADLCNGAEVCASGACQAGAPLDCDDDDLCTTDQCVPSVGCQHSVTVCSDGTACSIGVCHPQFGCTFQPVVCDDGNACTTDSCDDVTGCTHAAVTCDDDNACTTDTCDPSNGCQFVPRDCNDDDVCTADTCNPDTGDCGHEIVVNHPCEDQDECTANDRCTPSGLCVGDPMDVDDGNPCTVDACDPVTGSSHAPAPVGSPCSDGLMAVGVCDGTGVCVGIPQSESVVARVGGHDPDVTERRLGRGRHPVAGSADGLAAAFCEVLANGSARVGVAAFSELGQGLGRWGAPTTVLQPDPVVAAIPGGGFIVAYHDLLVDGDGLGVVLVKLDASGQQVSSAQGANETTLLGQHSPDVVWQDGRLWVSWQDDSMFPSEGGGRLCVRSFASNLVPLTSEVCDTASGHSRGAVSWAVAPGVPARAWRSESQGNARIDVAWGARAWSLPVDDPAPHGDLPALLALDPDHLLLAYTDGGGNQMLAVLDDGAPAPIALNPWPERSRFEPSLAMTQDGVFLAWREDAAGEVGWSPQLEETYVQKLSWDGGTLSLEDVWTLPHDDPFREGDQARPALASAPVTAMGILWTAWDDLREGQPDGPKHGDVRVSWMATPIEREELGQ